MACTGIVAKAGYSTSSSGPTNEPVVSVDWLHSNLREPDLKVTASFVPFVIYRLTYLNELVSVLFCSGFGCVMVAHIPGALFFDLDGISDRSTSLPHMLPSEEAFAAGCSALGIENKMESLFMMQRGSLVQHVYGVCVFLRRMFRVFGHEKVWVLDGGLPRWRAFQVMMLNLVHQVSPETFKTKFQPHLVWTLDKVKNNMKEQTHQHIDARSKARFDGTAPEPRKGIRSGHIPWKQMYSFSTGTVPWLSFRWTSWLRVGTLHHVYHKIGRLGKVWKLDQVLAACEI
ncbi:unnamed protein product [Eruca vesicaria subsp. sativa]|uniref:Rhodanese domain-containing protein n=1 Tax=Eruca vesicaria subsp. sativa TaxID=29727 RepID=A0ABC8KGJ4_ERUVS|nr:unnamed protein product [Eruca vesicaria subsp. sativa]